MGRSSLSINLPSGSTVENLRDRLESEFPQLDLGGTRVTIAVNLRYAGPDHLLAHGDEIAFLPPVEGG